MSQPLVFSALHIPTFEQNLDQHYGVVYRFLVRLSGDVDCAEELTQETFARAWAGRRHFRGEASPRTWLLHIARNVYLNTQRRNAETRIPTDELQAIPDNGTSGDPARRFAASQQRAAIMATLAALPEKQRSIVVLCDAEGLSYAEIAEVLGISLAAVKVNLFRARHAFRQLYAQHTGGLND